MGSLWNFEKNEYEVGCILTLANFSVQGIWKIPSKILEDSPLLVICKSTAQKENSTLPWFSLQKFEKIDCKLGYILIKRIFTSLENLWASKNILPRNVCQSSTSYVLKSMPSPGSSICLCIGKNWVYILKCQRSFPKKLRDPTIVG